MVGKLTQYIYIEINHEDGSEFNDPRLIADGSTVVEAADKETSVTGFFEKLAIHENNGRSNENKGEPGLTISCQFDVNRSNLKDRSRSLSPAKMYKSLKNGRDFVARKIGYRDQESFFTNQILPIIESSKFIKSNVHGEDDQVTDYYADNQ